MLQRTKGDISIWPLTPSAESFSLSPRPRPDKKSQRETDWRRLQFHFPFKPVTDVVVFLSPSRVTHGRGRDAGGGHTQSTWTDGRTATVIKRVSPADGKGLMESYTRLRHCLP